MALRPRTIRARATIAAAFVVAAALAGAGLLVVSTLHRRLVGGQRNAAELRARDVATLIADGHLPATLSIPGEDRALIQIVDQEGTVLVQGANTAGEKAIISSSRLRSVPFTTTSSGLPIGDGERFVVVARPVTTPTGVLTVITAESLESADDDTAAVTRLLLIGLPLMVGLVTVIVLRTTRSAFTPVSRMTAELASLSANDLHRRVSSPTDDDEIGELANTMNQLLGRLERSSERERRFVADASHELRSPLASIRTALEIADTHPDKIDLHVAIRDALADHVRLDRLVDDLLALARLDGEQIVDTDAVDLALLAALELNGRSELNIEISDALASAIVQGSETQLGRALRNLIDNALRHARTRVLVTTAVVGSRAVTYVDDDGPGVPVEDREFVFGRFSRRDSARAIDDGGSGIGLAIVQEVVEAHHGEVFVTDSPLGGARFTISLPAAVTSESAIAGTTHNQRLRRPHLHRGIRKRAETGAHS